MAKKKEKKKKKKPADRKGSLGEKDLDAVSGGMGPAWTKGGGASVGQAVSAGLTPSPAGPIPVPYPTATAPAATEEQVIYKKLE
jgi:hypothetical protein